MMRPAMDRPRERRGTPLTREMGRLLKAGALIVGVVLVVGSLPVVALWFWADDLEQPQAGGFAYRDEAASFTSVDGARISGNLRLPVGTGPFPALVVAHGSGRVTRDDYRAISEALALNGFALLTYDKRGVGESEGEYSGVGPRNAVAMLTLLADDVVAGAGYLEGRDDIDAERIGAYGVSQGGWIAPLALSRSDLLGYMVIISGTTVSVGAEIYYSELSGEGEGASARGTDAELSEQLATFEGPHGFDPMSVLAGLGKPGLWILGAADRSIPIPETVRRLEGLIADGEPLQLAVLPGVGHGMRNPRTGARSDNFPRVFRWLVDNVGRG